MLHDKLHGRDKNTKHFMIQASIPHPKSRLTLRKQTPQTSCTICPLAPPTKRTDIRVDTVKQL